MTISPVFLERTRRLIATALLVTLAACGGGGGGGDGGGTVTTYTVGGMAVGVNGPGLVLRNGSESLSVPATGGFTFATRLAQGAGYAVTVSGHPTGQTCSATNASGAMGSAHVSNIAVACVAAEPPPPPPPNTYTVGGEVTGMTGTGLVLTNNGGNDLAVTQSAFTFSTPIATGLPYLVAIATQPGGQTCSVSNASGTVGSGNVSNVRVNCGTPPPAVHTIAGTISTTGALTASGLVLHNNGGDPLAVMPGATSFSFKLRVAHGDGYNVTVATQPGTNLQNSQDCTVARGNDKANADISNVEVSCGVMGPLRLLGTDPPNNARDVSRTVHPKLNFSSPVDPATLPTGLSLVGRHGSRLVGHTAAAAGAVVTIAPTTKLLPLAHYDAFVNGAIRGRRGETLSDVDSREFTTADATWKQAAVASGALPLDFADNSRDPPSIAVDARGNAIAAWGGGPSPAPNVFVNRYDAATGAWGVPTPITAEPGSSSGPRIAMDAAGNAVVAWSHHNTAGYDVVWALRFDATAGRWGAPRVVSHTDGSKNFDPVAVVTPAGAGVVAWMRVDGNVFRVWFSRWGDAAQAWSTPEPLDDPQAPMWFTGSNALSMARADDGRIAVAWSARRFVAGAIAVIWAAVIQPDFAVTKAKVISNDFIDPETEPQVAASGTSFFVVWRQQQATTDTTRDFSNVWMATTSGFNWTRVHVAGSGDATVKALSPTVAACASCSGTSGGALVGWHERRASGTGGERVRTIFASTAATFSGLHDLAVHDEASGDMVPRLAVDSAGNALALWSRGTEAFAARYGLDSNAWGAAIPLGGDLTSSSGIGALGISATTGDAVWARERVIERNASGDVLRWDIQVRRFD